MPGEIPNDIYKLAKEQVLKDLKGDDIRTRAARLNSLKEGLIAARQVISNELTSEPLVGLNDPDNRLTRTTRQKIDHMLTRSIAFELEKRSRSSPDGFEIAVDAFAAIEYLINLIDELKIGRENRHRFNYFIETPLDLVVAILHLTNNAGYLG